MLPDSFFNRRPEAVAKDLLGKVIRRRWKGQWLSLRVIETEAYRIDEKGSHASLGRTPSRQALFMPAGTIYMYYARGGDSLNVSCRGEGNAVLFKSAYPWFDRKSPERTLKVMQELNPSPRPGEVRSREKIARGQTLLCKSLGLKVPDFNQRRFNRSFHIADVQETPKSIVQARRLGIPAGRDEHLMLRYIDSEYLRYCTRNPTTRRHHTKGVDWRELRSSTARR